MNKLSEIGRVAFRVEGERWVCYWAEPATMRGAVWLGSIHMGAVRQDDQRRVQFMTLMRDVAGDLIEREFGHRPVMPIEEARRAPEHERTGRS